MYQICGYGQMQLYKPKKPEEYPIEFPSNMSYPFSKPVMDYSRVQSLVQS